MIRLSIRQSYFLKNTCSIEFLRTLYYGLIKSRLQNGIDCLGGACKIKIQVIIETKKNIY